MFFVETLGPALSLREAAALKELVLVKLAGRQTASANELSAILTEFIRSQRRILNADDLIRHLAVTGQLKQQDAITYRLAA